MRCGAKCFQVQMDIDGKEEIKSTNARTPAEARKFIRAQLGEKVRILSVRERKRS